MFVRAMRRVWGTAWWGSGAELLSGSSLCTEPMVRHSPQNCTPNSQFHTVQFHDYTYGNFSDMEENCTYRENLKGYVTPYGYMCTHICVFVSFHQNRWRQNAMNEVTYNNFSDSDKKYVFAYPGNFKGLGHPLLIFLRRMFWITSFCGNVCGWCHTTVRVCTCERRDIMKFDFPTPVAVDL